MFQEATSYITPTDAESTCSFLEEAYCKKPPAIVKKCVTLFRKGQIIGQQQKKQDNYGDLEDIQPSS